jgi:hypothetical protein
MFCFSSTWVLVASLVWHCYSIVPFAQHCCFAPLAWHQCSSYSYLMLVFLLFDAVVLIFLFNAIVLFVRCCYFCLMPSLLLLKVVVLTRCCYYFCSILWLCSSCSTLFILFNVAVLCSTLLFFVHFRNLTFFVQFCYFWTLKNNSEIINCVIIGMQQSALKIDWYHMFENRCFETLVKLFFGNV